MTDSRRIYAWFLLLSKFQPRPTCPGPVEVSTRPIWSSSRSAAGWDSVHLIWSGRLQVGHKPYPNQPVDSPTLHKIMDQINQINLGNNFVRPIKPINRLIQTQYHLQCYHTKKSSKHKHCYTLKNREVLVKEGCSFWWSFGLEHFVQRLI